MKYQLVVDAPVGPCPLGPRETDRLPELGEVLQEEIDGEKRRLQVISVQHLPEVQHGTFKHDLVWVICRVL